jgi:hypothetical protein
MTIDDDRPDLYPPGATGHEMTVSYTLREILDKNSQTLASIDAKLDQKADKADLLEAAHEIKGLGLRVDKLETRREQDETVDGLKARQWKIVAVALALAGSFGGVIVAAVHLIH